MNDKQQKAIELLVNKDEDTTFDEIAEQAGVTPRTLRNWRNDPEFQKALSERAHEQVDSVTYRKAIDGDIRAVKEWNDLWGRKKDRKETDMFAFLEVTPADIKRIEKDVFEFVQAGRSMG